MDALQRAAAWLREARAVVVLTGAGISKESGVPTFRDGQSGLWANYDVEELASPGGFRRNPSLVWQWYAGRRALLEQIAPNAAHYALARLAEHKPVTVVTQNVDGLHQAAGSTGVLELHGNIRRYKCFDRGHPAPLEQVAAAEEPPRCEQCGSLVRPDVVWFGEILPQEVLAAAIEAVETADLMLVIGTSGIVHPAASLPFYAQEAGARTIEINPEQTELTPYLDLHLRGPAGAVVPALVASLEEE